jgi:hypothetical protein
MPDELRQIVPAPQPDIEATFAAYQATRQFYQEVQSREAIKRYCDWYYSTAELHRQELQQMRGELNILGWFRRGKR